MLTFAFTALVLGLCAIALYFAYRMVRGEFWRVVRRQRKAISNLRSEISKLEERLRLVEITSSGKTGEIQQPRSLKEKMEDRYAKKFGQVVEVNGQPTMVGGGQ